MGKKSVLVQLRKEFQNAIKKESAKLNQETDEVKRLHLLLKIQKIQIKIFFEKLKKLSKSDFELLIEERADEIGKQHTTLMNKVDSAVFDLSDNPSEFEKYKKMKKMQEKQNLEIINILGDVSVNKKMLERYLVIQLITDAQTSIQTLQNSLEYAEFLEGIKIVNNRLNFDNNWLIGIALIQLHENLIKKKISQLGGGIKEDESIAILIAKLTDFINKKEQRDVRLSLEMSSGLKKIRDIMTHEGFKHKITKPDLNTILLEILRLDKVLYPEKDIKN